MNSSSRVLSGSAPRGSCTGTASGTWKRRQSRSLSLATVRCSWPMTAQSTRQAQLSQSSTTCESSRQGLRSAEAPSILPSERNVEATARCGADIRDSRLCVRLPLLIRQGVSLALLSSQTRRVDMPNIVLRAPLADGIVSNSRPATLRGRAGRSRAGPWRPAATTGPIDRCRCALVASACRIADTRSRRPSIHPVAPGSVVPVGPSSLVYGISSASKCRSMVRPGAGSE